MDNLGRSQSIKKYDLYALIRACERYHSNIQHSIELKASDSLGFASSDVESLQMTRSSATIIFNFFNSCRFHFLLHSLCSEAKDTYRYVDKMLMYIFSRYLYLIWKKNRPFLQYGHSMDLLKKIAPWLSYQISENDLRELQLAKIFFYSRCCWHALHCLVRRVSRSEEISIEPFCLYWRDVASVQQKKGPMMLARNSVLGKRALDGVSMVKISLVMSSVAKARAMLPDACQGQLFLTFLNRLLAPRYCYVLLIDTKESENGKLLGVDSIVLGHFVYICHASYEIRRAPYQLYHLF